MIDINKFRVNENGQSLKPGDTKDPLKTITAKQVSDDDSEKKKEPLKNVIINKGADDNSDEKKEPLTKKTAKQGIDDDGTSRMEEIRRRTLCLKRRPIPKIDEQTDKKKSNSPSKIISSNQFFKDELAKKINHKNEEVNVNSLGKEPEKKNESSEPNKKLSVKERIAQLNKKK